MHPYRLCRVAHVVETPRGLAVDTMREEWPHERSRIANLFGQGGSVFRTERAVPYYVLPRLPPAPARA